MSAVYTFENLTDGEPKFLTASVSGKIFPFNVTSVTEILGSPVSPVHEPLNSDAVNVFVPGLYNKSVSLLSGSTPVGLSANNM